MEGASCLLITLERQYLGTEQGTMPERASARNFLPGSYRNVLVWAADRRTPSFTTYFRPPTVEIFVPFQGHGNASRRNNTPCSQL